MNDRGLSDKELFVLVKQNKTDAFTAIYNRYWSSMYSAARKRLKDEEACKDIVQNVFIDLWKRRETLEIDNLSAFIHTAVRFQVYKKVSRNKTAPASDFFDLFESMISTQFQTDDGIKEQELQDLFDKWLLALPEKRRKIFLMYYKEGLSSKEIAEKLDITQKTVQNQVHMATKGFKTRLTQFLSVYLIAVLSQL